MKHLSKLDANGLLGSRRKEGGSPLARFGTKSTTPSVMTSPALTDDTCVCDEGGKQDLIAPLDHHPKRFSARFQLDELSNRSLRHPFRARSSIGSKSTAVDSASFASRSPSSPPSSPSHCQQQLNTTSRPRSLSPAAYTCHPAFSPYSHPRPAICSQPPSQPPPTCPLPSPPADRPSINPPSSFRSTLSKSSFFAASPLPGSRAGRHLPSPTPQRVSPRLQPLAPLQSAYPSAAQCQALSHPGHDFYHDDPFAAEQLVVTRPANRFRAPWSDEESVDPLGPMPHPSRPTSVYTSASASSYSVNTTVERFARVSVDVASYTNTSQPDEHIHSISMSEDSQEGPRTPSVYSEDEDLGQSGVPPLRRMPVPSPGGSLSKCSSFLPSPLMETFSFGLPSRFDGLFFGHNKRPDSKYRAGPAIVLGVSPPISSTSFSPGDSIRVKVHLANLFDHLIVSFVGESRLLGERKLKSHRFLKHEIDLDRPGLWGCWTVQRGTSSKEWFVDLKIPTLSNCECGQRLCQQNSGGLELPSSTINNKVRIFGFFVGSDEDNSWRLLKQ